MPTINQLVKRGRPPQHLLHLVRIWQELTQHSQPCSHAAFSSELERLEFEPLSDLERTVATRSLARFGRQGVADDNLKICANEDWVRLFIALRRACVPDTRITPGLLREWKTKVASSTVVNSTLWRWRPLMLCLSTRPTWISGSSPRMSWCSRLTFIVTEP